MVTVTLSYIDRNSGSEVSKALTAYWVNPYSISIFKKIHDLNNFNKYEETLSYRKRISVGFAPIENDKDTVFFLLAFVGNDTKKISFTGYSETEVVMTNELDFNIKNGVFFIDPFEMSFIECEPTYVVDDGTTKTMKVTYGLDSTVGTYRCFICDDKSAESAKSEFMFFAGSYLKHVHHGYRHKIRLDLRPFTPSNVIDSAKLTWLYDFVLRKNKQIDTSLINAHNSKVYDVVFPSDAVEFELFQGIGDSIKTSLTFVESGIRRNAETTEEPFVLGKHTLGGRKLG